MSEFVMDQDCNGSKGLWGEICIQQEARMRRYA